MLFEIINKKLTVADTNELRKFTKWMTKNRTEKKWTPTSEAITSIFTENLWDEFLFDTPQTISQVHMKNNTETHVDEIDETLVDKVSFDLKLF